MSMNIGSGDNYSRVDKFDNWTNSETNYNSSINGEQVEQFQMFDFNASTYSSDLKNFAQEYINKYDTDEDAGMNFTEFVTMATNGEVDPAQMQLASEVYNNYLNIYKNDVVPKFDTDGDGEWSKEEFFASQGVDIGSLSAEERKAWEDTYTAFNINGGDNVDASELLMVANQDTMPKLPEMQYFNDMNNLLQTQYSALDLDGDGSVLSSEFAAQLYMSDLDLDNYAQTGGDVASSIDGKLDYTQYQVLSSLGPDDKGFEFLQAEKRSFYNHFYEN